MELVWAGWGEIIQVALNRPAWTQPPHSVGLAWTSGTPAIGG